jgi:DNA-binding MarR family transcriptional regulator
MRKDRRPAPLTAHLGFWLRFVSNHVSQSFARKLEERDVSVPEWAAMRELYDLDHLLPSVLAEKLGVTRGAISKIVDRLAAKGLATRMRGKRNEDGRTQSIQLTPKARNLVPVLAALADKNEREFFDHLTREDRVAIERILRSIVQTRGLKGIPID